MFVYSIGIYVLASVSALPHCLIVWGLCTIKTYIAGKPGTRVSIHPYTQDTKRQSVWSSIYMLGMMSVLPNAVGLVLLKEVGEHHHIHAVCKFYALQNVLASLAVCIYMCI